MIWDLARLSDEEARREELLFDRLYPLGSSEEAGRDEDRYKKYLWNGPDLRQRTTNAWLRHITTAGASSPASKDGKVEGTWEEALAKQRAAEEADIASGKTAALLQEDAAAVAARTDNVTARPAGAWRHGCTGCVVTSEYDGVKAERTLVCDACPTVAGHTRSSALRLSGCAQVDNVDGELKCTEEAAGEQERKANTWKSDDGGSLFGAHPADALSFVAFDALAFLSSAWSCVLVLVALTMYSKFYLPNEGFEGRNRRARKRVEVVLGIVWWLWFYRFSVAGWEAYGPSASAVDGHSGELRRRRLMTDDEVGEHLRVAVIGAGYAGLSAAKELLKLGASVRVFEASDHVGGRVRNIDLKTGQHDVASDTVLELGGTFVSPSHTALLALAESVGVLPYNVSRDLRRGVASKLREPQKGWPWWSYVDVGNVGGSSHQSVFLGPGRPPVRFTTPAELKAAMPAEVFCELEAAGDALKALAKNLSCEIAPPTGSHGTNSTAWFTLNSQTFEGWMRKELRLEESKAVLRAMTRGMVAQEPAVISLLSIVKSVAGCWSAGADDQYRLRGGTQAPLLAIAAALPESVLSLSTPAARVTQALAPGGIFTVVPANADSEGGFNRVIVTGCPAAVARIAFEPPLRAAPAQLLQRMPMGASLKYFVSYREAWWRARNLSGLVLSSRDADATGDLIDCCEEHSPFSEGSGAVLMCWVEGETNLRFSTLNASSQRAHVLGFLADALGDPRALTLALGTIAENWSDSPWVGGAYTGYFPPGVQSQPELWAAYSRGMLAPNVHVAGSDWIAGFGNGYIEGAVRSGVAAAHAAVGRGAGHRAKTDDDVSAGERPLARRAACPDGTRELNSTMSKESCPRWLMVSRRA